MEAHPYFKPLELTASLLPHEVVTDKVDLEGSRMWLTGKCPALNENLKLPSFFSFVDIEKQLRGSAYRSICRALVFVDWSGFEALEIWLSPYKSGLWYMTCHLSDREEPELVCEYMYRLTSMQSLNSGASFSERIWILFHSGVAPGDRWQVGIFVYLKAAEDWQTDRCFIITDAALTCCGKEDCKLEAVILLMICVHLWSQALCSEWDFITSGWNVLPLKGGWVLP